MYSQLQASYMPVTNQLEAIKWRIKLGNFFIAHSKLQALERDTQDGTLLSIQAYNHYASNFHSAYMAGAWSHVDQSGTLGLYQELPDVYLSTVYRSVHSINTNKKMSELRMDPFIMSLLTAYTGAIVHHHILTALGQGMTVYFILEDKGYVPVLQPVRKYSIIQSAANFFSHEPQADEVDQSIKDSAFRMVPNGDSVSVYFAGNSPTLTFSLGLYDFLFHVAAFTTPREKGLFKVRKDQVERVELFNNPKIDVYVPMLEPEEIKAVGGTDTCYGDAVGISDYTDRRLDLSRLTGKDGAFLDLPDLVNSLTDGTSNFRASFWMNNDFDTIISSSHFLPDLIMNGASLLEYNNTWIANG